MKTPFLPLVTALCLTAPAMVLAEPLACPEPAPVFAEAGAHAFNLSQMAETVGTAALDGEALTTVKQQIEADYPNASDADIADIMITSFCTYLNTDAPADHRSEATVSGFEKEVYNAVFGGTPPEDYTRQGWLYNN